MHRRTFLKQCAAWAALAPMASVWGCYGGHRPGRYDDFEVNFRGSVLVIGAGSAGLGAGYLLSRYGIDYQVLEASSRFGGRVMRADGFADFPLDLGAEWIHDDPSILAALVDNPNIGGSIEVIAYSPESISSWRGGRLRRHNWARNFVPQEYKFKRTTWRSIETYAPKR
ncbi:MAG: NAD(P)-binding protein [Myxococcota bacterium]